MNLQPYVRKMHTAGLSWDRTCSSWHPNFAFESGQKDGQVGLACNSSFYSEKYHCQISPPLGTWGPIQSLSELTDPRAVGWLWVQVRPVGSVVTEHLGTTGAGHIPPWARLWAELCCFWPLFKAWINPNLELSANIRLSCYGCRAADRLQVSWSRTAQGN